MRKRPGPRQRLCVRPCRWRIILIRKKGEVLGTVQARTAEEAVENAAAHFGIIDRDRRKRLVAYRVPRAGNLIAELGRYPDLASGRAAFADHVWMRPQRHLGPHRGGMGGGEA